MVFPVRRVRELMALGAIALSTLSLVSCASSQGTHQSALQVPATQPLGTRLDSQPASIDPSTLARRPPPIDAYLGKISPAVFSQLKYLPLLAPAYIPEAFLLNGHGVTTSGYFLIYRSQTDQCFAIEYAGPRSNSVDNAAGNSNDQVGDQDSFLEATANSTQPPSLNLVPRSQDIVFFESPVFGRGQKMFYGKAAQEIAAHESPGAKAKKAANEDGANENGAGTPSQPLSESSAPTDASATDDAVQQTSQSSGPSNKASLVSQWLTNSNGNYRYLSGAIIPQNYPAQTSCADVSLEESVKIITSLADLTAEPTESIEEGIVPLQDSELPDVKPEN